MSKNSTITINKIKLVENIDSKFYKEIEKKDEDVTWITVTDKDVKEKILQSYYDESSRSILQNAMDQSHTMSDFSRICNIPLTTCFRKFETLVRNGLLTKDDSRSKLGNIDVIRYKTTFKNLRIKVGNGKSTVQIAVDNCYQQNRLDPMRNENRKRRDLMKRVYRSELGIAMEILKIALNRGADGAIITSISRFGNLSHYVAVGICEKLIVAGFLEFVNSGRNKIYKITERGISFIKEFDAFMDLTRELNIRF